MFLSDTHADDMWSILCIAGYRQLAVNLGGEGSIFACRRESTSKECFSVLPLVRAIGGSVIGKTWVYKEQCYPLARRLEEHTSGNERQRASLRGIGRDPLAGGMVKINEHLKKISPLKGCWRLPVDTELCNCRKSVGERLTIKQNHLVCGFGWGH